MHRKLSASIALILLTACGGGGSTPPVNAPINSTDSACVSNGVDVNLTARTVTVCSYNANDTYSLDVTSGPLTVQQTSGQTWAINGNGFSTLVLDIDNGITTDTSTFTVCEPAGSVCSSNSI
jgi:hypothetical protein